MTFRRGAGVTARLARLTSSPRSALVVARGAGRRGVGERRRTQGAAAPAAGRGVGAAARGGARRRQAATRLFLGLALRFRFAREALFLLALARFGGVALARLARLALGARRLASTSGAAAILLLARRGLDERAGAASRSLVGQGAQRPRRRAARSARRRARASRRRRAGGGGAARRRGGGGRGRDGSRRRGGGRPPAPARRGLVSTPRPGQRDASPSRPRPPWCGRGRSSDAPSPCSTGRSSGASVLDGVTVRVLSPVFSSFTHPVPNPWPLRLVHCQSAQPSSSVAVDFVRPSPAAPSMRRRRDRPQVGGSATEKSRAAGPARRGQHVSHLCGPTPNPIAVESNNRRRCPAAASVPTSARRAAWRELALAVRRRRRAPRVSARDARLAQRVVDLGEAGRRPAPPCWRCDSDLQAVAPRAAGRRRRPGRPGRRPAPSGAGEAFFFTACATSVGARRTQTPRPGSLRLDVGRERAVRRRDEADHRLGRVAPRVATSQRSLASASSDLRPSPRVMHARSFRPHARPARAQASRPRSPSSRRPRRRGGLDPARA